MIQPPFPPDEEKRLAVLRNLKILDTPSEDRFDRITRIAAQVFRVPVVLISLVDADRQWFKSCQGLPASETPRAVSFCGHAILGDDVLIVPDTHLDPRFTDNPLVRGEPFIRFYAGCPLSGRDGSKLGTLCIIDRVPRQMEQEEVEVLRDLAVVAQHELTAGQMNRLLEKSEQLFRQLAENIQEIFWMTDLTRSHLIYISPSYEKTTGRSCESLYKNPKAFLEMVHPEDLQRVLSALEKQPWEGYDQEFRIVRPDRSVRWIRDRAFPINNPSGEIYRIAGIAEDITDRKRDEETIRHLAYYDALTDLPNRTLLHDRLQQAALIGLRDNKPLTLLLMDLNRFKEINDTLGHHKGDFVLKQVGERLKQVVRESDTVSRLGGDEFAVLLPGVGDIEYASLVAQKILKELEFPFTVDGLALEVGTSIGIAFFPEHAEEVNLLIQKADVAMYAAKEAGLGYVFYTPERDKDTAPRLALMGELCSAIENGELQMFYQPKISFKTGKVIAFEALARWRHPFHGLIMPDQFIPLAEQTGMTSQFTRWAINKALHQLYLWQEEGIDIPITMNLSTRNMKNEALSNLILELISKWNVTPDGLKLEITETAIMSDPIRASKTLTALHQIGVSLSIDDFGTGFSSLGYLKKLPVDEIKIDICYVSDMVDNPENSIIVRSMINLGHNLDLQVTAEGVENEETWNQLSEYGCDAAQGYYVSRPVPASELASWLNDCRFPS